MGITTESANAPLKFASVPRCRPTASATSSHGWTPLDSLFGNPNCGEGQVLHMKVHWELTDQERLGRSWSPQPQLTGGPLRLRWGADKINEVHAAGRYGSPESLDSHEVIKVPNCLRSVSPLTSEHELERYESYEQMDRVIGSRVELTFVPMQSAVDCPSHGARRLHASAGIHPHQHDGKYPPTDMNHSNVLRAQGFLEAGVPDPLVMRAWREGRMELPTSANYASPRGDA
ncbi:hypothetical protein LPU83_pLPU83b_0213 (plasmid) [Rhizobium favelukesii]|uniref:Uncharacterized protein n=1 Tax=Rhizobium favelukesii TaxID=348824 RepID=W6RG55_9HYPH|nr:hypothetical protein LPU83_pLPU83b_0213 [Rhizobium favelukesii]